MTSSSLRSLFPAAIAAAAVSTAADARTVDVSDIQGLIKASQEAQPGDEIIIAPGTYTLSGQARISIVKRPGPVTVRGGVGKAAETVIEGQGQDNESVHTLFDVTDSPGWTFQDFTTRDTFYHSFKFNGNSSGCVLRNVTMSNHGEAGVKGTSDPDSTAHPDHLIIENCDIGFTRSEGGTRGVVEGVDGVAVKGWIIRGCRFTNIQKNGGPAYAVFTKGNSMDTVIENNRFENCFIGASFGGGGTGVTYFRDEDPAIEHRGGAIRKNVFIGCTDAAIYINKGADCDIEGNTLLECVSHIQIRYPQSSARISGNRVRSNNQEPLIRCRDGAVILRDELNVRE